MLRVRPIFSACLFLALASTSWAGDGGNPAKIELRPEAFAFPDTGELAFFTGNENVLWAGVPAGNAVEVFVRKNGEDWVASGHSIPRQAAVVAEGERLFAAGGLRGDEVLADATVLRREAEDVVSSALPPLPEQRAFGSAVFHEGALYFAGGASEASGKSPSRSLYRLDPEAPAGGWEELESMPGPGRLWPTLASRFGELLIFGGAVAGPEEDGFSIAATAIGWRELPVDSTERRGWRELSAIPIPLLGAVVLPLGQSHAVLVGGVTGGETAAKARDLLAAGPSASTLIYHAVTDSWLESTALDDPLLRPAAALREAGALVADLSDRATYRLETQRTVRSLSFFDYAVIAVYLAVIAAVGLSFSRKQNSSAEFSLGDRKVSGWGAGISMFATAASSISFMAIPAQAFVGNLIWFFFSLMLIPGFFLQAYLLFPLLRKLEITSTYEFLERRFHPSLRYLASAQCIVFQLLGRMSVVLLLPSLAVSAVTGLNVFLCVAVIGTLTTLYTTLGGFEAVVWTDVLQGLLMVLGALVMVLLGISALPGGVGEFVAVSKEYHKFDLVYTQWDYTLPILWIGLLSWLFQQATFLGDQPVVQRVFSVRERDIKKLALTYAIFGILISLLVHGVGLACFAYFKANPGQMDPTMENDQVVPLFIVQRLPIGVAGLIIAALFAASMSTLSSSMNSVATIVVEDWFRKIHPGLSDRARLISLKILSVCIGVFGTGFALYLASMEVASIFKVWNELIALLGGGLGGIYILGLFSRRGNWAGAVVGLAVSIAATVAVKNLTPVHWSFYIFVALATCAGVGYLASLLIPCRRGELRGLTVFDTK